MFWDVFSCLFVSVIIPRVMTDLYVSFYVGNAWANEEVITF